MPQHLIRVLDNCGGQNKSSTTFRFDLMCCLLLRMEMTFIYLSGTLFFRIVTFKPNPLIPGHTHMQADTIVSRSKQALRKRQLWIPDEIAENINKVKGVGAQVLGEGDFHEWEDFLCKHFPAPPALFSKTYFWRIRGNVITMKRSVDAAEGITFLLGRACGVQHARSGIG
jgi:hypothetical protein